MIVKLMVKHINPKDFNTDNGLGYIKKQRNVKMEEN